MISVRVAAVAAVVMLCADAPGARAQWKALRFERDTSFNWRQLGFNSQVLTGHDGRMLVAPPYFRGEVTAYDSSMKKLPFKMDMSRGPRGDIFYATQWGLVGDSVWLLDPYYKQVVFIGLDGGVKRSIGWPSWIRPFWADRRKYPLFANVRFWYAAYPDATLLVQPMSPRKLFDTPGYDPDQDLIVRVDGDGRIVRTIARVPAMDGRLTLRSGAERTTITIPHYSRSFSRVSNDGRRIAVVSPIPTDSGAFRITLINEDGDTVFSRRYVVEGQRIAKARIDSIAAQQKAFGRYTVEQIRDTVRSLMPAFYTPVTGVDLGLDYSVWVAVWRPSKRMEDAEYFVVDGKGEARGIVAVLRGTRFVSRSLERLWVIQQDRAKNQTLLVRFLPAGAKAARPSRSARAGASSPQAPPRE